jgi:hypothetical protein
LFRLGLVGREERLGRGARGEEMEVEQVGR